jgi:hypothetical protein
MRFEFETDQAFESRKHGHAYVARLFFDTDTEKINREFLESMGRTWNGKQYYYEKWFVELTENDVIEARLTDGSWKNDYRYWYQICNDICVKITQTEAIDYITNQFMNQIKKFEDEPQANEAIVREAVSEIGERIKWKKVALALYKKLKDLELIE